MIEVEWGRRRGKGYSNVRDGWSEWESIVMDWCNTNRGYNLLYRICMSKYKEHIYLTMLPYIHVG